MSRRRRRDVRKVRDNQKKKVTVVEGERVREEESVQKMSKNRRRGSRGRDVRKGDDK